MKKIGLLLVVVMLVLTGCGHSESQKSKSYMSYYNKSVETQVPGYNEDFNSLLKVVNMDKDFDKAMKSVGSSFDDMLVTLPKDVADKVYTAFKQEVDTNVKMGNYMLTKEQMDEIAAQAATDLEAAQVQFYHFVKETVTAMKDSIIGVVKQEMGK